MFSYFKRCEYSNVRNKLLIVYALNINDIHLTKLLLATNQFVEANPIMGFLITTTFLTLFSKMILPALLIFYIIFRMKNASPVQLKRANVAVNIIFIIYVLINIMHLIWIIVYLIIF